MKKIILILIISFLLTFFITQEEKVNDLFGAETTVTLMQLEELITSDSSDYIIVYDASAGITKRISANNAIIEFLRRQGIDSLEVVELVVDTVVSGLTPPIIVLDTVNVIGQVYATYLKGDSTYTPIIVLDTVKSNVEITGYLNVPRDSLKINGTNITKTAIEINNTVDSVSVFSARSLSNVDSLAAHRTDINTNVDSIKAISTRSILNKDTLDTYIDGITYSKDLYDTGVTVAELAIMDGVTATTSEINKCGGISATAYQTVMEMLAFRETTGAGTYRGTITVPANSLILDVVWKNSKLWTATTSATLNVGDEDDPDGYFANINLKAEPVEATPTNPVSWSSFKSDAGTKAGAYAGLRKYSTSAQVITATVVTVGATGDAGISYMFVIYATPIAVNASKK